MIDPEAVSKAFGAVGELQNVIKFLANNDYGSSVMHVLNLVQEHHILPKIEQHKKCKLKSSLFRDEGNKYFKLNEFELALQFYNLALLHAPKGSKAMKIAYGNRSALFFRIKKFKACMKDIEKALALGYPEDLVGKLLSRQKVCMSKVDDQGVSQAVENACALFAKVTKAEHVNLPCASSAVDVVMIDGKRTIVANGFIEAGDTVAVEVPFMSHLSKENQNMCCYYCLRFYENLMPCDTCTVALYCNENCREASWRESHRVECSIMTTCTIFQNVFHLALKTIIKARNNCRSWEDLMKQVREANDVKNARRGFVQGKNGLQFDSNHYESICTFNPFEDHVKLGRMFNMILYAAITLHTLSDVFFGGAGEHKQEVMKFIGNQLVLLTVEGLAKNISAAVASPEDEKKLMYMPNKALGYFAFAGLLKHSCNPNVECYGLNNKIVMVAVRSMTAGTELFGCYGLSFLEADIKTRKYILYRHYDFNCHCVACDGNWVTAGDIDYNITKHQNEILLEACTKKFFLVSTLEEAAANYTPLCNGLPAFQNKPTCKYLSVYNNAVSKCLQRFQYHLSPQYMKCNEDELRLISLFRAT